MTSDERSRRRRITLVCLLILGAAACAGSSSPDNDPTAVPAAGNPAVGTAGSVGSLAGASAPQPGTTGSSGVGDVVPGGNAGTAAPGTAGSPPSMQPTAGAPASAGASGSQPASAGRGGSAGAPSDPIEPGDDGELIGWAAESGDGVARTTGGDGGQTVTARDEAQLIEYAESEDPLIIQLEGTFAIPELRVASNKTLIGMGPDATIEGGIRIRGKSVDETVSNVIVRNLRVHGASSDTDGDGMHIYFAHHVWIDHCEFWDAPDGNLDIVHASSWVTVSWSKFWYSEDAPAADHRFSNLVGHSDPNEEDEGRLKVTFHHNWWGPGVMERMPRVRYGDVHVFNNYYSAAGNNYAVGAGYEARLRIENNVFDGVKDPHVFYDDEPSAQIVSAGNAYQNTTGAQQTGQGSAFMPPYEYTLEPTGALGARVMAGAGPQ